MMAQEQVKHSVHRSTILMGCAIVISLLIFAYAFIEFDTNPLAWLPVRLYLLAGCIPAFTFFLALVLKLKFEKSGIVFAVTFSVIHLFAGVFFALDIMVNEWGSV